MEADEFARQSYDRSSRYLLAARCIAALDPTERAILDVGGAEGLLRDVLTDRQIRTLDIRTIGTDVIGTAARMPFGTGSFGVAVALDVFEHLPSEIRDDALVEMARVASTVVIAGPYDDPLVNDAENHQRVLFDALFNETHEWLDEHDKMGLPSLNDTIATLRQVGFETFHFGSNPLGVWEAELEESYISLRAGLDPTTLPDRRWLLREFFETADATPPSYRRVIVAAKRDDLRDIMTGVIPGSSEETVEQAVRRLERTTRANLGRGIDAMRSSLETGWRNTIRDKEVVEEELARRVRLYQSAPDERTVTALENVVQPAERRKLVAGPAVEAFHGIDPIRSAGDYDAWRSTRVPIPIPPAGPTFSVIVPVFNPRAEFLSACIRSVRAQTYQDWQLVLVNVSDAEHVLPMCRRFSLLDKRVQSIRQENLGIAGNTNSGVSASDGQWIVFLDHDDELHPDALSSLAWTLIAAPDADFIYSDEDKLDEHGTHVHPFFKPDWSPDLLMTVNYLSHLVAVRRDLFDSIGGIRKGFEGAQDFDFVLRATKVAQRIMHIPDVLYHWRQHSTSTASDVEAKPEAHAAGRRALQEFVNRYHPGAWVELGSSATSHRVRYPLSTQKVSIIIPFKDKAHLTAACLTSIARSRPELPFEILAVSNGSIEETTYQSMEMWSQEWEWFTAVQFDEPFNFQRLNNWAVQQCDGELLLFLNNDTEVLHEGWLEALAEHAQRPEIGTVGSRLFYPDGSVQHAGVVVGIGGFADHPWGTLHPDQWTPGGPSYWTRNFLALTAACMMVKRSAFETVEGFDERFIVCGGDVDFGLKLHEAGYWNVLQPFARTLHRESATRALQPPENDVTQSLIRYASILTSGDPFYNANLSLANRFVEINIGKNL